MRQGSRDEVQVDTLVHELNQRYKQEFDRAERYHDELKSIQGSRWWPLFQGLNQVTTRIKNYVKRSTPANEVAPLQSVSAPAFTPFTPRTDQIYTADDVSIIIPFRDQPELLERCVLPLYRTVPRAELILVDNGSAEHRTQKFIETCLLNRNVKVIREDQPFNYSTLCNSGATASSRSVLLFLNNDVMAIQPTWLEAMLEVIGDQRAGIAGATLLYPDRTIQHAGLFPSGPQGEWVHVHRHQPDHFPGENHELRRIRSVPAVTGACLMITRFLFYSVGGFDPAYPITHNDVSLCERVRQTGKQVVITPFARLWHFESLSRGYQREVA